MDKIEIINQTELFVKKVLENAESGHDWFHIQRVWNNAKLIAKNEALIKKQRGTVEESDFFNTREGYRLENKRTKLSSQFSSLDLRNKSKNNKLV